MAAVGRPSTARSDPAADRRVDAADADAKVELSLLRAWRCGRDPHSGPASRLLFAADRSVVAAAAALLERSAAALAVEAAARPPIPGTRQTAAGAAGAEWPPAALGRACDKLADCCDRLRPPAADGAAEGDELVPVAVRLVRAVAAAVRGHVADADAVQRLGHVVAAADELPPQLVLTAARELLTVPAPLPTDVLIPIRCKLTAVAVAVAVAAVRRPPSVLAVLPVMVELLTASVTADTTNLEWLGDPREIVNAVLGLVHLATNLQVPSLNLLAAVLSSPLASATAAHVRISGALRPLVWLLAHHDVRVRIASSAVLGLQVRHSPATDLVRALMEQGCVAVLAAAVSQRRHADQADNMLRWLQRQVAQRPQVVRSSCLTVLRGGNASLQLHLVLALQVLRCFSSDDDSDEAIRRAVADENFMDDVLQPALQADGTGEELATALLQAFASTCDPCSMLRLERSGSSFNLSRLSQPHNQADTILTIICSCGETVQVDVEAIQQHSGRVRRLVQASDSNIVPTLHLDDFQAQVVNVLVDMLSLSPPVAATRLKMLLPTLADQKNALRLAKTLEAPRGWHAATLALSDALSPSNWAEIVRFALSPAVRHPSLALRAVQFGLRSPCDRDELVEIATIVAREFCADW